MTDRRASGKVKKLKGRAREAVGIVTGDAALERKGSLQRAEGAIEEGVGKARKKVGELVDDVAEAFRK